jgi:hypothetical protein
VLRVVACAAAVMFAAGAARAAGGAVALTGTGVQIYDCTAKDSAFAWVLKAPEAVLTDAAGRPVGRHFAGPSWQAADGSVVTGDKLASSAAPLPGAVPWLVLRARSHQGAGMFGAVTYIVRTATQGGAAPATGCSAANTGREIRVKYTASYLFFSDMAAAPGVGKI